MKRNFVFLAAYLCAIAISSPAYSQTGGAGGGGGGGGAGTGGSGATGGAASGGQGTGGGGIQGGTGSSRIGVPGRTQPGAAIGAPGGQTPGTNAGSNNQFVPRRTLGPESFPDNPVGNQFHPRRTLGGPGQTPWFNNPAVRQQLQLNDSQFDRLNSGYRDAWNRYNQGLRGNATQGSRAEMQQELANSQAANRGNSLRNPNNAGVIQQGNEPVQGRALQDQRQRRSGQTRQNVNDGRLNRADRRISNGVNQAQATFSPDSQRLQQLRQVFDDEFSQVVDSTFTDAAARQRYNQLYLQYQGFDAFSNPAVGRQLNLDPNQQAQFENLSRQWNQGLERLQGAYEQDPQVANQQYRELQRQANEQLTALLTPQQLANWRRMTGSQFEFPATAYLRNNSAQSLDPVGDRTRARVNEQLEDQQNETIFDSNRGTNDGSTIGVDSNPGTATDNNATPR